jgi:D-arabinose 1-dehydrogenase-like Zn-dependent alcohol dehydrogenase
MRAGRLTVSTRTFAVVDVAIPKPQENEVLIKVMAAGVCLSDVHFLDGTLVSGSLKSDVVTLGHEVAGVIEEIGSSIADFHVGDHVVMVAGIRDPSGRLQTQGFDYDGGFAEYVICRADNLVRIPPSFPFEQACIIPDAVSTPWAAISQTANMQSQQSAVVFGVGGLGFHAIQLLKIIGCSVIAVDPSEFARTRALSVGADFVFDSNDSELVAKVKSATSGAGVNAAFDFAGVTSVRKPALSMLAEGGKLVIVGIANEPIIIPNDMAFTYRRTQLLGHYGSEKFHTEEVIQMVSQGILDLSHSISQILPLEQANDAMTLLRAKIGNPIRIVLTP